MSTGVLTSVVSDSRKIRSCVSCATPLTAVAFGSARADTELADRQVARLRAGLRVDPDVRLDRVGGDVVAAAASCISVPEYVMWSPTSNGACWRGSGPWPFSGGRVASAGMTNFVQNSWPAAGGVSSPLPGSGTTPASLKLRQWRVGAALRPRAG